MVLPPTVRYLIICITIKKKKKKDTKVLLVDKKLLTKSLPCFFNDFPSIATSESAAPLSYRDRRQDFPNKEKIKSNFLEEYVIIVT